MSGRNVAEIGCFADESEHPPSLPCGLTGLTCSSSCEAEAVEASQFQTHQTSRAFQDPKQRLLGAKLRANLKSRWAGSILALHNFFDHATSGLIAKCGRTHSPMVRVPHRQLLSRQVPPSTAKLFALAFMCVVRFVTDFIGCTLGKDNKVSPSARC